MPKKFKTVQVKRYYELLEQIEEASLRWDECYYCGGDLNVIDGVIHDSGYAEIVGKPPKTVSQIQIQHSRDCKARKYFSDLKRIREVYDR